MQEDKAEERAKILAKVFKKPSEEKKPTVK